MYIYGASGHGKVVSEIAEENNITVEGFIDQDQSKKQLLDCKVIHAVPNKPVDLVIAVGNNAVRKQIARANGNFRYLSLIHPKAAISKRAAIGEGTVIMAGAAVNSDVSVGKHCIINTCASLDHDCKIEDFVHISPNAALAGNVTIGEGSHIGIGATIIQGITVGKWCTVGAGAVIIRDVPDGAKVVGNPGRILE